MKPFSEIFSTSKARASDLAACASKEAGDTATAARERIAATYDHAKAGTSDVVAQSREQFSHLSQRAEAAVARSKAKAKVAGSNAKTVLDDHPLTVVAGALAVGATLALLIPKRRKAEPEDPVDSN